MGFKKNESTKLFLSFIRSEISKYLWEEKGKTWLVETREQGYLPLQGVGAHGGQPPLILRGWEEPHTERIRAEGQRVSKGVHLHLPHSSHPWGPTSASPGLFSYLHPLPTSSYRFPLLSSQASEASLSLKTLGDKNHEKLQGRAFSTQPLTLAPCPRSSVPIPGKGGGC